MFGEGVCPFVAAATIPGFSEFSPPTVDHFPYVLNVLHGPFLKVLLSLPIIGFPSYFAVQFIGYHAPTTLSFEPARLVAVFRVLMLQLHPRLRRL